MRKEAEVRVGQVNVPLKHCDKIKFNPAWIDCKHNSQTERINQHGISDEMAVKNVLSQK